jgi:hypothetical protein
VGRAQRRCSPEGLRQVRIWPGRCREGAHRGGVGADRGCRRAGRGRNFPTYSPRTAVDSRLDPITAGPHERASGRRFRRSSLKERGRVKPLATADLGCVRPRRTRRSRRRGQGSGGARPRSGRRALRSAPGSTNNVGGGDSSGAGPQKSRWVGCALVRAGFPAGGRPRWAAGHPYAAAGAP